MEGTGVGKTLQVWDTVATYSPYTLKTVAAAKLPSLDKEGQGWLNPV